MTSLRVGVPFPTVTSFGTDSNSCLFISFSSYSETSFLKHASVFLLVGQVNFNLFKTIAAIPIDDLL